MFSYESGVRNELWFSRQASEGPNVDVLTGFTTEYVYFGFQKDKLVEMDCRYEENYDSPHSRRVMLEKQLGKKYYTYGQTASGYVDTPSLEEERFDLDTTQAGKLTLKNRTDEAYGKVYVYYKYVQVGGIYLGGITYRVPFENLPAGGTAESPAGHFHPKNSRIMAVVVMAE